MYRLQVMYGRQWRWGIRAYDNVEAAVTRLNELAAVGIKARVKPETELFN